MIIVLFHVLYLFGKYVYENLNGRREKTDITLATNQVLNVTEADYRDFPQTDYDSKNVKIKFFPPVYVQRYTTVQHVLASGQYQGKIRKVVDFGCAELAFAIHLKNTEGVQEIICVDVDKAVLESFQSKVAPLHCDYLSLRTEPLKIHVCEGSIAHIDNKLANSDAVTCIELIEHLYPDDLDAFPYNVFGFIKPQVAIVTTPNADFNVLFTDMKGFRHYDHKFEWTRKQFQDWANNITIRYPNYEVSFHGIGAGPPGTEQLGSCSQMAVFHRLTPQLHSERVEGVDGLLKTIVFHDYPYRADNRSDEEKILDEAVYYIRLFSSRDEEMTEEIPIEKLMFAVQKFHISVEILRSILSEANWAIADREDGPVVLVPPQSTFSDHSNSDFNNFLEADYRYHTDDDWNDLEPGAPSGYLFDSYMERDEQGYDEEENWDDETHDDRRSSNSNLDNIQSAELQLSENLGHASDSQWTMEDLNNEDPLLEVLQNQPSITKNNSNLETELPRNSFSIRLDRTDTDYLNTSNNTIDSSERNLSSPLPLSDLSEVSRSLESANSHVLSENQSLSLPNDRFEESAPSNASNTDTCVKIKNDLEFDSRPEAVDRIDCRLLRNKTSSVSTEEATFLLSREQSLLLDNKKHLSPTDQISLENKQFLINSREGLKEGIGGIPQNSDASIPTDKFISGGNNCGDICSMYLQPSFMSNNFLDTSNEVSLNLTNSLTAHEIYTCLDVTSDNRDPCRQKCYTDPVGEEKIGSVEAKSRDSMSFRSISDSSLDLQPKYTSSPQISTDIFSGEGETDNGAERFPERTNLKNVCKRVSVPQHLPHCVQSRLTVGGRNIENTYQSSKRQNMKDELDRYSLNPEMNVLPRIDNSSENQKSIEDEITLQKRKFVEDQKIGESKSITNLAEAKSVDNISPTTSQLSLYSNVSSSTATSTRSSNVDKWYVAEANPMYQRDIVMLKGGNDAADNPNEEATSDSDVAVSDSDKDKHTKIIGIIDHKEKAADSCYEAIGNQSHENSIDDTTDKIYQTVSAITRSNSLSKETINPELSSDFVQRKSHESSIENSCAKDIRVKHNSKDLNSYSKNKTEDLDGRFSVQVEEILENVTDDTYEKLVCPITKNDSIVDENLKCNIYEVTQTLTESAKKISEKVDDTKSKLESTLETTKKMLEISPLVSGSAELDSTGTEIQFIQSIDKYVNEDVGIRKFVPEHLSDFRKIGFSKPTDKKEFPSVDFSSTNIGERSQSRPTLGTNLFKSTPSAEVSTSFNVNKIGKERGHLKYELEPTRTIECIETKTFSPESLDTSPNSWSPEIMDSGYPNSASVHEITPEYDLSSIANDRISDSDSASVEEAPPVPAFYEFIEVENGDLANNNRDDEGNNVMAFEANDIDDLQPLIDVLEIDMENENDIYVHQNGFPLWLLRILEMANPIDIEGLGGPQAQLYAAPRQQAGGDAPNLNAENDEGFDSSSSEDESDIEDDEADDATTVSSDETEDRSTENLRGDWRAGGDP